MGRIGRMVGVLPERRGRQRTENGDCYTFGKRPTSREAPSSPLPTQSTSPDDQKWKLYPLSGKGNEKYESNGRHGSDETTLPVLVHTVHLVHRVHRLWWKAGTVSTFGHRGWLTVRAKARWGLRRKLDASQKWNSPRFPFSACLNVRAIPTPFVPFVVVVFCGSWWL
jgi:hypothetical protein